MLSLKVRYKGKNGHVHLFYYFSYHSLSLYYHYSIKVE